MNARTRSPLTRAVMALGWFIWGGTTPCAAQTVQSAKIKSAPTSSVTTSYAVTYGFKPQYFDDSGQYLEHSFALQFKPAMRMDLTLRGYVYQYWEPLRRTEVGDTLVRLSREDLLRVGRYRVSARADGSLPTSPVSHDEELRGKLGSRITNTLPWDRLRVFHHLSGQKFFYEETLNAEGEANRDYEWTNTLGLNLKLTAALSVEASGSVVNRFYHQGPRKDLWESGISMALALTPKIAASAGLVTSQAQIKNGRRTAVKLYEKDITEAYSGLSFLF